jgi:8-amino-7-oxononanoate synthase
MARNVVHRHLPRPSKRTGAAETPLLRKAREYTKPQEARAGGFYPYFRPISSAQDAEVLIDGRKVLMLGSNSYLGLTNHPEIKQEIRATVQKYGSGCAGSRFLNGTLDIHVMLEEELAEFVGKEAVVLFSTGFQANLGAVSTLVGRNEYVIADKEDHASIIDGCLLSPGHFVRFNHNDIPSLRAQLEKIDRHTGKLVVVDGIFSMTGDITPLPGIVEVCEQYGATLMVDDAHAIGVLGKEGAGTSSHFGLTDHVHVIMGTFSKSLASIGGFIASDTATIEYIKHHSRPLIFSASMSPANVAAVRAALRIMRREPERIERLWRNTRFMRTRLDQLGFETGGSETPVIPIYCYDVYRTLRIAVRLQEEGVFVNPVVPPAVPPNGALIRISIMATHTEAQMERALDKLVKVGREMGLFDEGLRSNDVVHR